MASDCKTGILKDTYLGFGIAVALRIVMETWMACSLDFYAFVLVELWVCFAVVIVKERLNHSYPISIERVSFPLIEQMVCHVGMEILNMKVTDLVWLVSVVSEIEIVKCSPFSQSAYYVEALAILKPTSFWFEFSHVAQVVVLVVMAS